LNLVLLLEYPVESEYNQKKKPLNLNQRERSGMEKAKKLEIFSDYI